MYVSSLQRSSVDLHRFTMNLLVLVLLASGVASFENERVSFDLIRFSHAQQQILPILQPRSTCQTKCSNGGCCNTGGPCTTDGMCCLQGETACSEGGCCPAGSTCTTTPSGSQICQGYYACVAPPVSCGIACCDAGMLCITVGNQFRCEYNSSAAAKAEQTTNTAPQLGDSPRTTTGAGSTSTGGPASKSGGTSRFAVGKAVGTFPFIMMGLIILLVF
jgi:hypothetical protein